ncbi:MAG: YkgJ family cysteine cluster protein [Candidatus Obscuribacter sp.]|nr:YkgJ family cysteine cluster protein [Candidatus Obscuribacter sp.]
MQAADHQDHPSIFVPETIRFQCTFCGNCCHQWPVPLTELDAQRLSEELALPLSALPVDTLSRAESESTGLKGFTRALLKGDGGKCSFLNQEGLCQLEGKAKPSMCQLFPFTFVHTPEGLYTGLSFASTGVLENKGALLSEQPEVLNKMADLFERLNPGLAQATLQGWQRIELYDGQPLPYEQFLELQGELLHGVFAIMQAPLTYPKISVLRFLTEFFCEIQNIEPTRQTLVNRLGDPIAMDSYLLSGFANNFFEDNATAVMVRPDRLVQRIAMMMQDGKAVESIDSLDLTFAQLQDHAIGKQPLSTEDIFARYAYVRLFSRLYLGPGLSGLSFSAGLGHLCLILILARLRLKRLIMQFPEQTDRHYQFALESIRLVESKWTALKYASDGKNMLEIFFLDKDRPKRLYELVS